MSGTRLLSKMPSRNRAIVACAGCGKTTEVVKASGAAEIKRAAIITYTQKNHAEIQRKFYGIHGRVLPNVDVETWYTFLLSHLVRPYQTYLRGPRIAEVAWVNQKSVPYTPKKNVAKFYFSSSGRIYSDKISEFAVHCDRISGGKVLSRLEQVYSHIFIDEFQDLAGWDFEILELLLKSTIKVMMVGDHRQRTYTTNNAAKNKQYVGEGILRLILKWEQSGLCQSEPRVENHRGIQPICDLGDLVFPYSSRMKATSTVRTDHDGVFVVRSNDVSAYISRYKPQILRWSAATDVGELSALNFGEAKGLTFPRVLIYPTGPIKRFLATADPVHIKAARSKLYVAVTRAQSSVAFVFDNECMVKDVEVFQP